MTFAIYAFFSYSLGFAFGYAAAVAVSKKKRGAIVKRHTDTVSLYDWMEQNVGNSTKAQSGTAVAIRPKTDKERGVEKIIKRNEGKGGTPLKDIL